MQALIEQPKSLGGVPIPRTFDPSTGQAMPDYSREPILSTGGVMDELSAAGQAEGWAERYRKALAEIETEDDDARNAEAGRDLSPARFREIVCAECPGRRWKVQIWAYVYSDHYPEGMNDAAHHATVFYGPDDDKGVPLKADNLRDLARLMREAHEHMGRAGAAAKLVPVVEVAV